MYILLPKNGEDFALRSFTREDAERLADIEFDAEVKRFLARPKKDKPQWIREFDPDSYDGWAVDLDGVLAGRASILRGKRRRDGELAIVIGRPFWGLRLGRKVAAMLIQAAFDELNAKALVAVVHPENQASILLLRAFKFRRRGIVVAPAEHWQQGHFIYRLPRGAYNRRLQADAKVPPATGPLAAPVRLAPRQKSNMTGVLR